MIMNGLGGAFKIVKKRAMELSKAETLHHARAASLMVTISAYGDCQAALSLTYWMEKGFGDTGCSPLKSSLIA